MFIAKRHLPRRTFLRGMGATIALPLLDAMVPAGTALANTAPSRARATRSCIVPHGAITGLLARRQAVGKSWELSPILQPFAPFKDHITVISNTRSPRWPTSLSPEESAGDHVARRPCILSAAHSEAHRRPGHLRRHHDRPGARAARSAKRTPCPRSRCASRTSARSASAASATAAPTRTRSLGRRRPRRCRWSATRRSSSSGCSATAARPRSASARKREDRSILDSVLADSVGAAARPRPRATSPASTTISTTSARSSGASRSREQTRPSTASGRRPRRCRSTSTSKLMLDLQVLAFKADITRVATMMFSRDLSGEVYPESGVPDAYHALSHHQDDPTRMERYAKLNAYHCRVVGVLPRQAASRAGRRRQPARQLARDVRQPDGQLERARPLSLPVLIAGHGAGRYEGNRHIDGRAAHADREPVHDARREGRHRARRASATAPVRSRSSSMARRFRSWTALAVLARGCRHCCRAGCATHRSRRRVFGGAGRARRAVVRIDLHELPRDHGVHGRRRLSRRRRRASRSGKRSSTSGRRCPRTSPAR